LAAVVLSLANATTGVAGDPRLARPHAVAPTATFLGVSNWPLVFSALFVVVAILLVGGFAWASWRDRVAHRALIVIGAVTILSVLDPPANWVTYTVFDPRFLHFNTGWAYLKLAPLVEPVVNVPGYPMYYGLLGLFGAWVAGRYLRSERGVRSRHPLLAVFVIGFLVGVAWDIPTELFMLRARMYFYSELWGPVIGLSNVRYPIVWGFFVWLSIALTTLIMVADDTGRSRVLSLLSGKWAQRRGRPGRPSASRELVAGVVILALGYALCMGIYGTLRITGADHPSQAPWPYTQTRVYDPYGDMKQAHIPGPYYR
jgi:hypothetical protein